MFVTDVSKPHPPDYGRTCYISPPAIIHPLPLIMDGQVTFPLLLPHPLPQITEGQITFPLQLPHPPGCGRTSYTSYPATTPTWLRKVKLHLPSSYYNHLVTEGQVTHPLQLPHPPGYERTSYIYPPATPNWL